ncbi:interferon-inducible GTPase 5-like [Mustelus asterias]
MDLEVERILKRFSEAMKDGGISKMAPLVKAERRRVECVTVHVAVTGTPRVGKSVFINSVMDFKDGTADAAPTDPTQQVAKPASYRRPGDPCCMFWELPNIEGVSFSPDGYLKALEVDRYVGFFILSSSRFTWEAVALANELRRIGKQVYFVRTNIDLDTHGYKNKEFAEDALRAVTADCFDHLDIEYAITHYFCVSCHDTERFDFMACIQALQNSSPPLQKHALLLSLYYLANKIELKNSLKELIPVSAIYSCIIDPVPVERLPYQANISFLHKEICFYRTVLGLDYQALNKSARLIGQPTFVLSDEIQTRLARELTEKAVSEELLRWTEKNVLVSPRNTKWLPLLETLPGRQISGASTIRLLDAMLEQFMDDAYRIQRKIAEILRGD